MAGHSDSTVRRASGGASHRASQLGVASRLTPGWRAADGHAPLQAHLDTYGPVPQHGAGRHNMLIDAVTQAGLTGRGGAGFPTGIKMRAVASGRGQAVVVANGMESEPASEKDKSLLSLAPHLVLDGAALAAAAVGADVVRVCVPRSASALAAILSDAIAERQRAHLDQVEIGLNDPPQHYVSSEETALVHWL